MRVRDVMTANVISVSAQATILEAARTMLRNRVSGLPVVDAQGRLVGIVTEGDFLRRNEIGTERRRPKWLEFVLGPGRMAEDYVRAAGRKVEDVMTRDPIGVREDDDGRRADGETPCQALSGAARRQDRRHRQPRQSDARAGQSGAH